MIVDRAQLQLAKEMGLRVDDPLLDARHRPHRRAED